MSQTLPVVINRDAVHEIAIGTEAFETDRSFIVEIENAGQATHVHLSLDDDLSRAASVDGGGNYFVEAGAVYRVRISVDREAAPTTGRLSVVTGYGARRAHAAVTISETPPTKEPRVAVDERLGVPQRGQRSSPRPRPRARDGRGRPRGPLLVGALAVGVLGLALVVWLVAESVAAGVGVAVVAGFVAASYFLSEGSL
ncbi:DUF7524 family protein [Natronorarus salvus]|uniref:DUF7524 family protein n=1 Tax=Natronorarus salvus TaxID=3117733 RepID=UPI002F2655AB